MERLNLTTADGGGLLVTESVITGHLLLLAQDATSGEVVSVRLAPEQYARLTAYLAERVARATTWASGPPVVAQHVVDSYQVAGVTS